tara:strand:+ start:940 stop:1332 length:393 start_codon:yes stop_codon:yes gene_type:complete
MANISIKLNLKQLKHVEREISGKDGKKIKCLIIPLEENMIYHGEKGSYLSLTAIELKEKRQDSKDTHLIKQDIPKEKYDSMSDEERKSYPILGNAIYWGGHREPAPVQSEALSESAIDAYNDESHDDLPF